MYPEDDSLQHFDLQTDVPSNAYVEVKAMQDQAGQIYATRLEVEDSFQEFEVEGPLGNFTDGVSITSMGVTFNVDGTTSYVPLNQTPQPGDDVDITDLDGDGTADQVEIED